MLGKVSRRSFIFAFLSLVLLFTGCDYQGNMNINQPPEVYISSFTGRDTPEEADALGSVPYQQKIYWYGKDADGVIVGYAYRIINEAGDPMTTAGNEVISNYTPKELAAADPQNKGGWVLHYQKGTSDEYPLHHESSQTTVWTEKVFTDVNFPAADAEGNKEDRASLFEIYAIDNRGAISKRAVKYFYATSEIPTILVSTSKGVLDDSLKAVIDSTGAIQSSYKALGQGVRMVFSMPDQRIGIIINKPWYYRYRLFQADKFTLNPIPGQEEEDIEWKTTQYLPNTSEVLLRTVPYSDSKGNRVPSLKSNFQPNQSQPETITIFDVQVVDMAGVRSSVVRKYFLVDAKYSPAALIYIDRTYALGSDHYTREDDPLLSKMITEPPKSYTATGTRVARLFYPTPLLDTVTQQLTGFEWQLFGDPFTKFWFRWGYFGELRGNDPHANRENILNSEVFEAVVDPRFGGANGVNYGSEITNFYVSLDGDQYPYPPLQVAGLQDHQYPNFLKIPVGHEIAQIVTRSGFSPGKHTLTIMVEDLQDKASDPVSVGFNLIRKKSPSERIGKVLYIDYNSGNNDNNFIKAFYQDIFDSLGMTFTYVKKNAVDNLRKADARFYSEKLRRSTRLFPITFLQDYEYVIVASDLLAGSLGTFVLDDGEIEGMVEYMSSGGKVIIVANRNASDLIRDNPKDMSKPAYIRNFPREYFGLPLSSTADFPTPPGINPTLHFFFQDPTPAAPNVPNINIVTEKPSGEQQDSTVLIVNNGALNTATCILSDDRLAPGATVLYRFNCVPTSSSYNTFHNKPIGIKFTPSNPTQGVTYTFTFPLYHLQPDSARRLMAYITERG